MGKSKHEIVKTENAMENLQSVIQYVVIGAILIYSIPTIYQVADEAGLPSLACYILPVLFDVNIIGILTMIHQRRKKNQNIGWLITYAVYTAVFMIAFYAQKLFYVMGPPTEVRPGFNINVPIGIIFLIYFVPTFYVLMIMKTLTLSDKANEKARPVRERAYEFFIEHEIENGEKLTGKQYFKEFGVPVTTVNEWRREWKASLSQSSVKEDAPVNGTRVPSQVL